MTTYLDLRNVQQYSATGVNYSTLTGSTIATNTVTIGSTLTVSSLRASAAVTYSTLSGSTIAANTAVVGSTLTGSTILATGNIGIGTALPVAPFQVYNGAVSYLSTPTMMVSDGGGDNNGAYSMINLTRPPNPGDNKGYISFIRAGNIVTTMGYFNNSNTFGLMNAGNMNTTSGISLASDGKVGIGTTAPASVLEVYGTTCVARGAVGRFIEFGSAADVSFIDFHSKDSFNADYDARIVSYGGSGSATTGGARLEFYASTINVLGTPGYVGIGTTSPSALHHVYGQGTSGGSSGLRDNTLRVYGYQPGIYFDGSATGANRVWNMWLGASAGDGGGTGAFNLYDQTASAFRFIINTDGTVRFPGYSTNGTIGTDSTGKIVAGTSDRRIKENIEYQTDTEAALVAVNGLRPATFNFIDSKDKRLGFIAQDIETLIPLAVDGKKYEYVWQTNEDGTPKFDGDGNIVYKLDEQGQKIIRPRGISDISIIAVQTLAIQALTARLSAKTQQLDSVIAWARTMGYSG